MIQNQFEFQQVETLEGIEVKEIYAWNMCACVDKDRNLYVWGSIKGSKRSFRIPDPVQIEDITVS